MKLVKRQGGLMSHLGTTDSREVEKLTAPTADKSWDSFMERTSSRFAVPAYDPVVVYPGEDEMLSLALGGLRVLRGEEKAKTYTKVENPGY